MSSLDQYDRFYCTHMSVCAADVGVSFTLVWINFTLYPAVMDSCELFWNWMSFIHMAGHVLARCLVMLHDKQASIKKRNQLPAQSQAFLKRSTCSLVQNNDSGEGIRRNRCSVTAVRTTCADAAQVETPSSLKHTAFSGNNDCVGQSCLRNLQRNVSFV